MNPNRKVNSPQKITNKQNLYFLSPFIEGLSKTEDELLFRGGDV